MNANFSAGACLVKTSPSGSGYSANARGIPAFAARTEKKNIPRRRFVPPGADGRFFDGHH